MIRATFSVFMILAPIVVSTTARGASRSEDVMNRETRDVLSHENLDVNRYDRYLALRLPNDVRLVFENLQRASRENHLPAFERCSGRY